MKQKMGFICFCIFRVSDLVNGSEEMREVGWAAGLREMHPSDAVMKLELRNEDFKRSRQNVRFADVAAEMHVCYF